MLLLDREGESRAHTPPDDSSSGQEALSKSECEPTRRRFGTIARLIAVQVLLVGIALGLVVFETTTIFTAQTLHSLQNDLSEEVTEFTQAAHIRPPGQSLFDFSRSYLQTHSISPGHHLIIALDGSPVLASGHTSLLARNPAITHWLVAPPVTAQFTSATMGGGQYQMLVSPIISGGRRIGVLLPFISLKTASSQTSQVTTLAEIQASIALLATALSSYLLLRHLLRIVGRITDTAEEIAAGDLDRRIGYRGTDDEVGRLAITFDGMTERLSSAMGNQRKLLSDVSHQLRTPLTVARGHLEVLLRGGSHDPEEVDGTVSLVVDELQQATVLVDRLLMLGRSIEPDFLDLQLVDVTAFMADLFGAATVLADRNWVLGALPDVVIRADAMKLRGAIFNLIDNAVKATDVGDTISLTATVEGDTLVLAVGDSGCGIPPELQADVFERFRRGDNPRQRGSGLGLAIVKAVAEAHGGTCKLSSVPGEGCRLSIELPIDAKISIGEHP